MSIQTASTKQALVSSQAHTVKTNAPLPAVGANSRLNSEQIDQAQVPAQRVEGMVSMLDAQNEMRTGQFRPLEEAPAPLRLHYSGSGEARKARSDGDQVEADDPFEDTSVVENDAAEERCGGIKVEPPSKVYEES